MRDSSARSHMQANIIQFLSSLALSASLLFIPNLARDLGAGNTQIGIIVAVYASAIFAASYVFGRLSDMYSRKLFISVGLGVCTITFLLQTLADPHFVAPILANPSLLALVRGLAGFSLGIFPAALTVYVYESAGVVGKFTSLGALGWAIGTLVAGVIAFYYGIFILSSACFLLAFLVSFTMKLANGPRIKVPLLPKGLLRRNWRVYVPFLLRHTGANCIWVVYPLFIESLGGNRFWVGVIYTVNTAAQFVVMRFLDRFNEKALMNAGLLLAIATFLGFTLAQSYLQLLPVQVLLACSWSSIYVGSLTYLMKNNVEKATSTGILGSVINISQVFGSLMGGAISQFFDYRATMYVAAAMTIAGLGLSRVRNKENQRT